MEHIQFSFWTNHSGHKVVIPLNGLKWMWHGCTFNVPFTLVWHTSHAHHVQSPLYTYARTFTLSNPTTNSLNSMWYLQQHVFHCFIYLTNQGVKVRKWLSSIWTFGFANLKIVKNLSCKTQKDNSIKNFSFKKNLKDFEKVTMIFICSPPNC
jgi:hypothetical protein